MNPMKTDIEENDTAGIEEEMIFPTIKLTKEIKEAVKGLGKAEVRYLVDTYYQRQNDRIRSAGQMRALEQGADHGPAKSGVLAWLHGHEEALEGQLKLALGHYAKNDPVGKWLLDIKGIGPVIAAGLLSHLDIEKAPTAGHFWNFAGMNPGTTWDKGQKRPWNAKLKVLCFKIGESFVKCQGRDGAFYADQFTARKAFEIERNDNGYFAEHAKAKEYAKSTEAWPWVNGCYPAGTCGQMAGLDLKGRAQLLKDLRVEPGLGQRMIPPAHVHSIARRWVVKLFLSHLHAFWFENHFGVKAPEPYAISILGHAHKIERPK